MTNWKILSLHRRTADGFVFTAHWEATFTDGEYSSRVDSACYFSGDLTTPYEDLTQDQVLNWVWEQVNKQEIEAILAAQIDEQKNPVSAIGVPW
jgi:hypothetical protein